jgi:hypothetical protein
MVSPALSDDEIFHRPPLPREFHELFDDPEAAVRHAFAVGNARLKEAIADGAAGGDPWPRRMETMIDRLLDTVEKDPSLAALCLVYGRRAGGPAAPFESGLVQALAGVIRPGRQHGPKPGPGPRAEELVAYGVLGVIAERLRRDEADSLRGLEGELSELVTMPFREVDPLPITS